MFYMPKRLLKEKTDGIHVPQFHIDYIGNTTIFLHKLLGRVVSWCAIYVVGYQRVGTPIIGEFHKV